AARFDPVPGTRLPLDAVLRDDAGQPVRLAALFDRPVVLVPGYYTCPNLCSTVFEGVLQALALSGLAAGDYRLVGLSIDPRDGAAAAAERKRGGVCFSHLRAPATERQGGGGGGGGE
ncbi:SCO family protein, partial [Massilia sp. CT11-108]|uniref:SCO family protein n=1 Tax=Massilia sp. CT11-108 TaxID=3393900 RepID=UPI0039A4488A